MNSSLLIISTLLAVTQAVTQFGACCWSRRGVVAVAHGGDKAISRVIAHVLDRLACQSDFRRRTFQLQLKSCSTWVFGSNCCESSPVAPPRPLLREPARLEAHSCLTQAFLRITLVASTLVAIVPNLTRGVSRHSCREGPRPAATVPRFARSTGSGRRPLGVRVGGGVGGLAAPYTLYTTCSCPNIPAWSALASSQRGRPGDGSLRHTRTSSYHTPHTAY